MSRNRKHEKVCCYRLDGTLFRVYDSAKQAALKRRAHPRTIDKCIRGDSLTAFGYLWRRYPEDDIPPQIEAFTRPTTTMSSKPIAEVSKDGEIIKEYPSIKQAGKELQIDPHSIRDVLKKKYAQTKGHYFVYLDNARDEFEHTFSLGKKSVIQLSLDGKYVRSYKSISEAAKTLGKREQGISDCLKGKYSTAYGFKWMYKNEPNVKRKETQIIQLSKEKKIIHRYRSVKEASQMTGISVSSLNNCLCGKQKTAGGYRWMKKTKLV